MHVANNSLLGVLQALGWADPKATEFTVGALALSVLVQAAAAWWLVRTANRLGVERTRPAITLSEAAATSTQAAVASIQASGTSVQARRPAHGRAPSA